MDYVDCSIVIGEKHDLNPSSAIAATPDQLFAVAAL